MRCRELGLGIFVCALVVFGGAMPVSAVGVAVQPAALRIAAEWGSMGSGAILVSNTTMRPAMYAVTTARVGPLEVAPAAFRLDPGESQPVTLRYRPRGFLDSRQMVSVVARPLDGRGMSVASGVRYPVTLVATSPLLNHCVRGGFLVGIILFAFAVRRRLSLPSHL